MSSYYQDTNGVWWSRQITLQHYCRPLCLSVNVCLCVCGCVCVLKYELVVGGVPTTPADMRGYEKKGKKSCHHEGAHFVAQG